MWFKQTPVGVEYFESGPFRFVNECELDATPTEVFAILADPSEWPRWFPDFLSAKWLTPPPVGVGSERLAVLKTVKAKEHFIVWEESRRMAFSVHEASLPLTSAMAEDYTLQEIPGGKTRFVWTVVYTPKLLARAIHPILRVVFGKMFKGATKGLETYVATRKQTAARAA